MYEEIKIIEMGVGFEIVYCNGLNQKRNRRKYE